jgi:hypothetical protein
MWQRCALLLLSLLPWEQAHVECTWQAGLLQLQSD